MNRNRTRGWIRITLYLCLLSQEIKLYVNFQVEWKFRDQQWVLEYYWQMFAHPANQTPTSQRSTIINRSFVFVIFCGISCLFKMDNGHRKSCLNRTNRNYIVLQNNLQSNVKRESFPINFIPRFQLKSP